MAKKKSINGRTFYVYPGLHKDVAEALSDKVTNVWYRGKRSKAVAENEYQTHVMGKFTCSNGACQTTGWGSKKITIIIRGYSANGYDAKVYNQRCRSCNELGTLTLDESSYVDRVAYRIAKWAGLYVNQHHHSAREGPPHRQDLCEGCKAGVCQRF